MWPTSHNRNVENQPVVLHIFVNQIVEKPQSVFGRRAITEASILRLRPLSYVILDNRYVLHRKEILWLWENMLAQRQA